MLTIDKKRIKNTNIEIMNNKVRHNLIDAKCRWHSDWLDKAGSNRELLSQTKVMQIRQRETLNHQGAITHEVCCLAAQLLKRGRANPNLKKINLTVQVVHIYLRVSFEHGFSEGNIVNESFNLALHPPITKFNFT